MKVPSYHHDAPRDQVPMTPMIDIVFLLLIFFVCASVGQIREFLLPTDLPPGDIESQVSQEREPPLLGELWLRLRRTESQHTVVEFNNAEFGQTFEEFGPLEGHLRQLAQVAPEIPVILDIDAAVPVQDMIRVYDICRAAHFESVHFAAKIATTP